MSAKPSAGSAWSNEINVTPMIDVLLVLLIIFMMIIPLSRRAIDVQLPEPESRTTATEGIVLEVLADSSFRLNKAPIASADLGARLRAAYAGRPDKTLLVSGSPRASYQQVVAAMDRARGSGVLVIGVHPRP